MSWKKPTSESIWQAIDIYLKDAYAGAAPAAVRDRVDKLKQTLPEKLFDSDLLERDKESPPARYCIRLGNKFYPHMKLAIERSPDGKSHLFRADTHDRHIRPAPGSRDAAAFEQLMQMNQNLAAQIESDWATSGLPTFKQYLRDDLARRAGEAKAIKPPAAANKP